MTPCRCIRSSSLNRKRKDRKTRRNFCDFTTEIIFRKKRNLPRLLLLHKINKSILNFIILIVFKQWRSIHSVYHVNIQFINIRKCTVNTELEYTINIFSHAQHFDSSSKLPTFGCFGYTYISFLENCNSKAKPTVKLQFLSLKFFISSNLI